jgi:hypothetical protein
MNEANGKLENASSRRLELIAVVSFVIINLVAPLVVGEMYPFTISPMFCDQPEQYCTYQLFDDQGNELDLESYGLHLVYDGNPPGLGMGIEATPRLHEFGEVPELESVVAHLKETASSVKPDCKTIRVCQSVVCCNGTCPEATVREATISIRSEMQVVE